MLKPAFTLKPHAQARSHFFNGKKRAGKVTFFVGGRVKKTCSRTKLLLKAEVVGGRVKKTCSRTKLLLKAAVVGGRVKNAA